MSQVTLQGNASGTGIFTLAAPNSNTNRTLNLPDAAGDVVLTTATQTLTNKSISGAQINSGTVAVARLGSGTPGTGNFLRGDGSWQTVPAPSTTDVLNATAGASVGAVGTYNVGGVNTNNLIARGSTVAGSSLEILNSTFGPAPFQAGNTRVTAGLSGTWRAMQEAQESDSGYHRPTLWLRIS
jgi:hypothetical protein